MEFVMSFFLLGLLGGALPDLLRIVKNREDLAFTRTPGFWVGLLILIGLGGLAAWLGGADTEVAALALGFAAPEVLSRLVGATKPESDPVAPAEPVDPVAPAQPAPAIRTDGGVRRVDTKAAATAPNVQSSVLQWWST